MKPLARIIFVSSLALVAAGCDSVTEKVESIGIIGGEDGPTAVWLTSPLPSWTWTPGMETLEPEFLDYTIPAFATKPGMSVEEVLSSLEQTLNQALGNGIGGNRFVQITYATAINYMAPMPEMSWTNATVRTIFADIVKADHLHPRCFWNPALSRIAFLVPDELSDEEWREFVKDAGNFVNLANPVKETQTKRSNP